MITEELSEEDIETRLQALIDGVELHDHESNRPTSATTWTEMDDAEPAAYYGEREAYTVPERARFIRPLAQAAEEWIELAQNTEGRWLTGLPNLDAVTRGFGKGELVLVTGFSHSGKTMLHLSSVIRHLDRPSVLITPDESEILVLARLVGMHLRLDGEQLEAQIKAGDAQTISLVRESAAQAFKNVIVVENAYTLEDFTQVMAEATLYFGEPPHVVCIDYLESIRGVEPNDVEAKAQALKSWTKRQQCPVICIHQGSRGNAGKGQKLTLQSMKYGGEAEANFVIGVRRPSDDPEAGLDPNDPQVLVSVLKNKRPPGRKGESLYVMDTRCGLIEPEVTIGRPPTHKPLLPRS